MRKTFFAFLLILVILLSLSCVTERLEEIRPGQYRVIPNTPPPWQITSAPAEQVPSQSIEDFMKDCRTEPDGRLTKFYRISHQSGDALIGILNNYKSPQGRIINYPQTKTIVITETPDTMKTLAEILARLDSPSPQVLIKVRMAETRSTSNFEYGFEYNQDRTGRSSLISRLDARLNPKNYNDSLKTGATPFQGSTFTLATSGKAAGDIDIIIRALQESGNVKILSCPDILVTEGQSATLHTGEQVPFQEIQAQGTNLLYFTKFKDVGAHLIVTPNFIGNESVTLRVQPEVSSLTGWTDPSQVGGISNPIISTRRCETTVTVRDGETLVIGGLLEDKKVLTRRSVPILGSIPVLGYLFSSIRYETDRTALNFILNVKIVSPEKPQNAPTIREPEPEAK
jgi:type II secretory pathway component GspD/PulD (secretin)